LELNDPEYFRILRSLLPFLHFPMQKHFCILLKLMELQHTMNYYQQPHEEDSSCSPEERSRKMLKSIRDACNPDKRGMFDMMMNAMNMQELMQKSSHMQEMMNHFMGTGSPSAQQPENDLTATLKKDLTPEQQGMFDMLSNMLGGISL